MHQRNILNDEQGVWIREVYAIVPATERGHDESPVTVHEFIFERMED